MSRVPGLVTEGMEDPNFKVIMDGIETLRPACLTWNCVPSQKKEVKKNASASKENIDCWVNNYKTEKDKKLTTYLYKFSLD